MTVKDELCNKFLTQNFIENDELNNCLSHYRSVAASYAQIENAIAVLSDLKERVSYVYYGGIAEHLGIGIPGECRRISSIWEDDVFSIFTHSDMEKRHIDELRFLHFLKSIPLKLKQHYYLNSILRAGNRHKGQFCIRHRVFYVGYQPNGSVRLALCLYNASLGADENALIINTLTGEITPLQQHDCGDLLSEREKAVLKLIDEGKISKEISHSLSISIHTVNRHRQNILAKLNVSNSIEACRIATAMGLL